MLKLFLAYASTLRTILLDYVRSLKCDLAVILTESIFPVLHFLYLDLVRTGLRDHLRSHSFGVSEEMQRFSGELMITLGMLY